MKRTRLYHASVIGSLALAASSAVVMSGCASPRQLSAEMIAAEPGLADAARSVLPMILIPGLDVHTAAPNGSGELSVGSAVVLASDRLFTAAHVVVDKIPKGDETVFAHLSLIGDRPRHARILEHGDPEGWRDDWALLLVEPIDAPPVAGLTVPEVGERCVVIGYPTSRLPDGWGNRIVVHDPNGEATWTPPAPIAFEGCVARLDARYGYRIATAGPRGYSLGGLSGGGAFVQRNGKWMLIGVVSGTERSPFHLDLAIAPLNDAARAAWIGPPPP